TLKSSASAGCGSATGSKPCCGRPKNSEVALVAVTSWAPVSRKRAVVRSANATVPATFVSVLEKPLYQTSSGADAHTAVALGSLTRPIAVPLGESVKTERGLATMALPGVKDHTPW